MSMFKKRGRRNIRKKATALEDEQSEGEDDGAATERAGGGSANGQTNAKLPSTETTSKKKKESRSLLSFDDELADEGPEFKVKKTSLSRRAAKMTERERKEKKTKRKKDVVVSGIEMEEEEESEAEEEAGGHLASLSEQLKVGIIPNADLIHRARREREERRQMGGGVTPSVMSLSVTNKKIQIAKGKSRLIREDDNDRSDDSGGEEGGRRRMDAGHHDTAAVKQFQVLQGLEEMGSDSDEETKRWEEEQIEKGVKASAPDQAAPLNSVPSHLSAIEQSFLGGSGTGYGDGTSFMTPAYTAAVQAYAGYHEQVSDVPPAPTGANSFQIPEKLVPITVESLKSRLSNQLRDLQDSTSGHHKRLEQIRTDFERSQNEVAQADARKGDLGMDYKFFQEMRGYLRDLLSCLGEKEPEIASMERAIGKVKKERSDLLAERRRQDIMDQDKDCGQPEVQQVTVPLEVQSRQRRAVEREGRRRRRRERRERGEGRREGEAEEHRQGMSTDDELLEMNRLKFENSMTKALSRRDDIFSDVVDDFWELSYIKERLEEWKFSFPRSYSNAHIPLYLPQLFAPFVRLQMLSWNPLEADCPDFEAMNWFESLMFYGFREGVEPDPNDPDTRLLPELVDRVIVTKLTSLVREVWDPLSTSQTRRLTSLVRQLAEDYPTVTRDRSNTQSLFAAILTRLRRATQDDVFIPLYTSTQVENSSSPRSVFYNQQFWSCVKLLGNITEWEELIAPDALQELVLDGLLNRYLVLALQTCPYSSLSVLKTEAIISRLPASWLADGSTVTRPLQHLVTYIVQLAEQLHRLSLGHPDHLRQKTRSLIRDLAGQLSRLGAVTEANSLCKEQSSFLS